MDIRPKLNSGRSFDVVDVISMSCFREIYLAYPREAVFILKLNIVTEFKQIGICLSKQIRNQ